MHRQSEIYAREGVDLERSTLADWVGSPSKLLEPLNEALRKHFMAAEKLHADDTPVPVLEPGKGRSVPLITSLHEWRQQTLAKVSPKSDIAGAISYALGRWPDLLRYCDNGLLEIDNKPPNAPYVPSRLDAVAVECKDWIWPRELNSQADCGPQTAVASEHVERHLELNIDPNDHRTFGPCECCGNMTQRVWGYVYDSNAALAAYFVEWTPGHVEQSANFDLIVGLWGEDTSASDRVAVALEYRCVDSGPAFMVINADARPVARNANVGKALMREEVIGTELGGTIFAICDQIFLHDTRLNTLAGCDH